MKNLNKILLLLLIGTFSCNNDPIAIIGSRLENLPEKYYDLEELLIISEYSNRTNRYILVNFKDETELSIELTEWFETEMLNYISDSMLLVNMPLNDTSNLRTIRNQENYNKSNGVLNDEFKKKYLELNDEIKAVILNGKLEITNKISGLESKIEISKKLKTTNK